MPAHLQIIFLIKHPLQTSTSRILNSNRRLHINLKMKQNKIKMFDLMQKSTVDLNTDA